MRKYLLSRDGKKIAAAGKEKGVRTILFIMAILALVRNVFTHRNTINLDTARAINADVKQLICAIVTGNVTGILPRENDAWSHKKSR